MEDKNKEIDDQEAVLQIGSGAMLAAARKEQNKTIEEIADKLNLSQTQIRTIELDQSEGLPEPTYVRGYIRSYAKLLGLDAEQVLEHYLNKNWQKSAKLDDIPRGIGDAEPTENSVFSPARVIVFLLILGALGFFWWSGGLDRLMGQNEQSSVSSNEQRVPERPTDSLINPAADSARADGVVESDQTQPRFSVQSTAAPTEDAVLESVGASTTPLTDTAIVDQPAQPQETQLVLTFSETSWVDIRDEQQNRLAYQSYPADETLTVSAEGILSVLIGNAKGVQMTVNGQAYDLGQHTEGVYAKFSVGTP